MAVHALDDPLHNIKAHASAGLIADLVGRGESGRKDILQCFRIGQRLSLLGADEPKLDRLGANLRQIQAGPIVFHFNNDGVPAMRGMEVDGAHGRLSLGHAVGRRFDAVIDRVADEVNQWIDQSLHHSRIDFGMFAGMCTSDTSLFEALAISRIARRKRVNGVPTGTIRARAISSRMPRVSC